MSRWPPTSPGAARQARQTAELHAGASQTASAQVDLNLGLLKVTAALTVPAAPATCSSCAKESLNVKVLSRKTLKSHKAISHQPLACHASPRYVVGELLRRM